MASSPPASARGAGQEQMLARPTRRPPQSRLLPKLKHTAMISMSTQKRSDLLRRLELTDMFMLHCSRQVTFRADSPLQSNCLVAGIIRPMTQVYCEIIRGTASLVIKGRHGAQEGQAGSHWDSDPVIQAAQLFVQGGWKASSALKLSQLTRTNKLPNDPLVAHTMRRRGYALHLPRAWSRSRARAFRT